MTTPTIESVYLTPEEQELLRIGLENLKKGVRDPKLMREASERTQRRLEEQRRVYGVTNFGVRFIREYRDGLE